LVPISAPAPASAYGHFFTEAMRGKTKIKKKLPKITCRYFNNVKGEVVPDNTINVQRPYS
jgi:hypothetical protein